MQNGNGKTPRENTSFSIDIGLLSLLKEYCHRNDRSQSDATNRAIKLLLANEMAETQAFWEERYGEVKE